jgi:hypothetical protein
MRCVCPGDGHTCSQLRIKGLERLLAQGTKPIAMLFLVKKQKTKGTTRLRTDVILAEVLLEIRWDSL